MKCGWGEEDEGKKVESKWKIFSHFILLCENGNKVSFFERFYSSHTKKEEKKNSEKWNLWMSLLYIDAWVN